MIVSIVTNSGAQRTAALLKTWDAPAAFARTLGRFHRPELKTDWTRREIHTPRLHT